jgi:hypothetical protein
MTAVEEVMDGITEETVRIPLHVGADSHLPEAAIEIDLLSAAVTTAPRSLRSSPALLV